MRKVREILRLALVKQVSNREVARSCSVAPATVGSYLERIKAAGFTYVQIEGMEDGQLKELLKIGESKSPKPVRPQPNWEQIHKELKNKGVTLQLLWEEYKRNHPDGYQSSQFYEHYNRWKGKLDISLRQTYKAGEKLFVDYAGQTIGITDRASGQVREAQIFVATLGASSYTYAEATWDAYSGDIGHSFRNLMDSDSGK